jgi:hypothetical protein
MKRLGFTIAAVVVGLMSLAAPAFAVTEEECGMLEGYQEGPEDNPVCIFPGDPEDCEALDGFPTRDEDECIVPIEEEEFEEED